MGVEDRKAREFKRREDEILKATLKLVSQDNWKDITIDDIAEKAEIGKGTFYKHFNSKDEACARIVMGHMEGLVAKLSAIDTSQDYGSRMATTIRTIWRHHMDHPELLPLKSYCESDGENLNLSESFSTSFRGLQMEMHALLHEMVSDGINKGAIAESNVDFPLYAGWALTEGAIRIFQETNLAKMLSEEMFIEYLIDFLQKGMQSAKAPSGKVN